jgi:hypothetical protein
MQTFRLFQSSRIFLLYAFLAIKIKVNFCENEKYSQCFQIEIDNLEAIFEQLLKAEWNLSIYHN